MHREAAGIRLFRRLFFFFALVAPLHGFAGQTVECGLDRYDEIAELGRVIDGDTIRLKDGRKVRFTAINTPELARGKNKPAEPFGEEARTRLQQRLAQEQTLLLRHGQQARDKYKRLLAHVFLRDGTNLQAWLLEQGLAQHSLEPPNLWRTDCYAEKERLARTSQRGIWSHPHYAAIDAAKVSRKNTGFYRVTGRIEKISHGKRRSWLTLSEKLALRIERRDMKYFPAGMIDRLKGKSVIAKGWMFPYKGDLNLRLRHPAALEILD